MRAADCVRLVLTACVPLAGVARAAEPPLSAGSVALFVLDPPSQTSSARIAAALAHPEAAVRAAAARVAGAAAPEGGCATLKSALKAEKDAEAAREEIRGVVSLCGDAPGYLTGRLAALPAPLRPEVAYALARRLGLGAGALGFGVLRPTLDSAPVAERFFRLAAGASRTSTTALASMASGAGDAAALRAIVRNAARDGFLPSDETLRAALAAPDAAIAGAEDWVGAVSGAGRPEAERAAWSAAAAREIADARAAAPKRLTVKAGRSEPRPVAERAPLVRTVTDLPRGVAAGAAKATGCSLASASLALADVTFRAQGTPEALNPRLMPADSGCRKAALALFALSLPPGDYLPPAGSPDRLAVVFDADALAAIDEDPVGTAEPRTLAAGGSMKEPKEILRVKPAYPESLRRQRAEGLAVLTVRIDREGRVKDVRVVEPVGTLAAIARDGTSLDLEALRSVSRWRYEPAQLDGAPVPVLLTVSVSWSVSGTPMPMSSNPSMRR